MAPIIEQLPNEPLFDHLLHSFTAHPRHVLVHDPKNGVEADCSQLLTDILYMRHQIFQALPASSFDARRRIDPENPYVIVLAPGNYDYIVAALSTLACGGAFAPISSTLAPEEACHLLETTNASCMLVSPQFEAQGSQIARYCAARNKSVAIIPIAVNNAPAAPRPLVRIDPAMTLDPTSPGVLIFTSGTTGPPKGVVRPRRVWYNSPPCFPSNHVVLAFRSPHWVGVAMRLIWQVLAGTRAEVIENDPRVIWESFCTARVSRFSAPPRTYAQLMKYFQEHIDCLPVEQRSRYVKGVRALQRVTVSGGVTWPTVMGFWRELLGRPLRNIYSSTEVTAAIETTEDSDPNLERCIGKPCRGVQVKLSDGDHGEILLKSATMFTHYLGNEAATRAVLDEEGYYKSGDFGHLVGDQYVIDGRSSTDFIPYRGLRVPVHEVEARLIELPYISEAYVVPASFHYMRQVAAVIRPQTSKAAVSLSQIRVDLQDKLQRYKLPTLLRTLHDNEQVPETTTGKPLRRKMEEKYFSLPEEPPLPAGVEFCDTDVGTEETPRRAWDWGGMM
ncbi:hypothetical protein BDV32DRAFT_160308 [Aspergillus pseudonomiae]|uniref:AMP-dependent synthetase/ligase domain-containing protein n=1 Tax=Aspergillus pseudonomiae TaxID=1506151 RepID=A0A5N6HTV8_9EURO|nr:uncharacterized protein BDV37DRAFT_279444 [Aspergillus pseudonomiae]KAB8257941.1 hypothetical protein BDV32DRAFT_160308 [Aspergillus pseudonomiae]KAE8408075.1 hypothetical protein BDV37DRAFT_279444 [Aspergillus pseudonomiae]